MVLLIGFGMSSEKMENQAVVKLFRQAREYSIEQHLIIEACQHQASYFILMEPSGNDRRFQQILVNFKLADIQRKFLPPPIPQHPHPLLRVTHTLGGIIYRFLGISEYGTRIDILVSRHLFLCDNVDNFLSRKFFVLR